MLAVVKIFQIRGKVILCCGATSSSDSFILHRKIFNSSLIVLKCREETFQSQIEALTSLHMR